jgi:thioredoxin-related protein
MLKYRNLLITIVKVDLRCAEANPPLHKYCIFAHVSKHFMRAVLFAFFLLSLSLQSLNGQQKIKWMTLDEVLEKSRTEKRKIFIDVYTHWCGWCKKMDKTTFSEENIIQYINEHYYPVKFDAQYTEVVRFKGQDYQFIKQGHTGYHELAAKLLHGQMSFPSIVFLDEEFNVIQSIPGYQDHYHFEMIATYFAENHHRNIPWSRYAENYRKNHPSGNSQRKN